jgi:hypothetical protein
LDTYTDSNTRERRPYECDGLIAATGRGLLQNDPMWGRHSHSWVLEVPTWPVEWMQVGLPSSVLTCSALLRKQCLHSAASNERIHMYTVYVF